MLPHLQEKTLAPFPGEEQSLRDGLRGLDVSELICSFPNCPCPTTTALNTEPRSGCTHTYPAAPMRPPPSLPLPRSVRRDSTGYFCSWSLCCAILLLWLPPGSCARGQGLFQGRSRGLPQCCSTTGWDGGVLPAVGTGSSYGPAPTPAPSTAGLAQDAGEGQLCHGSS